MLDPSALVKSIEDAVRTRDSKTLEKIVRECASFSFKESVPEQETFPEGLFGPILSLMEREEFLTLAGSSHLLMLFEYDWSRLDEDQRNRLLDAIRRTYAKFDDWMACFVISELLGEYYCNENAFRVLCELQDSSNVIARSLVPHGFEHIIKGADSVALRDEAMSRLKSMKNDSSPQVRSEVGVALSNLG